MFALWYHLGKDPKGRGVIVAEYTVPENLAPLEAAGLIEGKVTARHVSAAIIGLAVFGYVTIRKIKEENVRLIIKLAEIRQRKSKLTEHSSSSGKKWR
jgi:hypothetical protein